MKNKLNKEELKQEKFRYDAQQEEYEEAVEQEKELEELEQEYNDLLCEDYDNEKDEDD